MWNFARKLCHKNSQKPHSTKKPSSKSSNVGFWLVGWLVSEKPHLLWRGKKSVRGITWARYFSISTSALGRCTWAPATSTWPVSWLLSPLDWTEGSMKGEGLRKVVKEWWNNLELPNQLNYQTSIFTKKDESNHVFSRPSISTQHLTQLEKRLVEHFGTSRQSNHKPWIITIITIGWNVLKTFNSIMTLKLLESIR